MIYKLAKLVYCWIHEKILSNYCTVCGKRLVLYNDGVFDCPDLNAEEVKRRKGKQ